MATPCLQPAIRFIDFRVKNVSYSCQVDVFSLTFSRLNIDFHYEVLFDSDTLYRIAFYVKIQAPEETLSIKIQAEALYESNFSINQETLKDSAKHLLIHQNSPAIAFPFLRSFIHSFTVNLGISPIILPVYNFTKEN